MRREEFLKKLEQSLIGEVSQNEMNEHLRYYREYISGAVSQGREEEEVIEELGGPQLVAKTIIEARNYGHDSKQEKYTYDYGRGRSYDANDSQSDGGFRGDYSSDGNWDVRMGKWKLNSWYGKLALICILVLAVVIVIAIVTSMLSIVSFLLPILLPIAVICLVISIFRKQ